MDISIKTWLYDIQNSIMEIDGFFIGQNKSYTVFINDLKTKRAIERNLEIIGEAMNRMLKKDASIVITNSRKFVDIRNRIIHGYDSVSDDIIWGVVIKHLPILRKEVEQMLLS
jgi:uncharacterized protein with HEPN domain